MQSGSAGASNGLFDVVSQVSASVGGPLAYWIVLGLAVGQVLVDAHMPLPRL